MHVNVKYDNFLQPKVPTRDDTSTKIRNFSAALPQENPSARNRPHYNTDRNTYLDPIRLPPSSPNTAYPLISAKINYCYVGQEREEISGTSVPVPRPRLLNREKPQAKPAILTSPHLTFPSSPDETRKENALSHLSSSFPLPSTLSQQSPSQKPHKYR
jgi:hypothetical protein